MVETSSGVKRSVGLEKDAGKRFLLQVGFLLQLLLMAVGLWPAVWLVLRYREAAGSAGHWVLLILCAVIVFNCGYLLSLLLLRIVIPRPKEGAYTLLPGKRIPGQVVLFTLNALLVKFRFEPPWAATFSAVLVKTFPLHALFNHFFGPRTSSMTLGDTIFCLDPHLVEIGKNVQLGFQCTILAHMFDNRGLVIRKVVICDHAVIGSQAVLMPGVRVGHHAVIAIRSVVQPNTVIGAYEYWAGNPARKVRTLITEDQPLGGIKSETEYPSPTSAES